MSSLLKHILVGKPKPTAAIPHQRLGIPAALAVFSSDGLSSVAYATEEILLVLVVGGSAAAALSLPIGLAIVVLVFIVAASYSQTIHAYPSGGGSYIVSKENLGVHAGLVAAAALLIDYVLTVAVSAAAGVAAITSAFPRLHGYEVSLSLIAIWVIAVVNLRGVRESGAVFSVPTYGFIGAIFLLLGVGLLRVVQGDWHPPTPPLAGFGWGGDLDSLVGSVGMFQILRAFASGCTAVTGIEAISNGVQAFRPPEADNAMKAMRLERTLMYTMFAGITLLAFGFQAWPKEDETVLSQIAREVFGGGFFYYTVQASTAMILLLAANTAYADFPRLSSFLARDGFMPRQMANRGDRLVFSNGILVLVSLASILLIVFGGSTHLLIPLYVVGVFVAFTLSQAGMVVHWVTLREGRWIHAALLNGVGAFLTAVVLVVVAVTKFTHGAWIVVVLIPLIVLAFLRVRHHYDVVARRLSLEGAARPKIGKNPVVVLVAGIHKGVVGALEYAKSISPNVIALTVDLDPTQTAKLLLKWAEWSPDVPLVVLESPYRSILQPFMEYIDRMERQGDGCYLTVVLPEFIPSHWWEHFLHNQTALLIKAALLFKPGKVTVSVPYHLGD
ncbi:MAG: amino acid permease [candidate division NC10 bacterium RIFCSPLOWO2_12_FULL_66_18]|nr:MAG: amino acid permease [candidate division NC10 bacterium RIFCSPLOWO2_02_FULL_66_22]OGC02897.1 MAG: amino acid permease [candidate division NC10 bacterium RIFCSPLOWO2_12_FULL_66_18]